MFLKFDQESELAQMSAVPLPPTPNGTPDYDKYTDTKVENRFVIYGQRHITGIDIEQPNEGRALVTLNKGTTTRDMLQGVFRLRKILFKQRADFVISSMYQQILKEQLKSLLTNEPDFTDQLQLEHLVLMAAYYQYENIKGENRTVVFQKINAILRKCLLETPNSPDATEAFEKFYRLSIFVRRSQEDFFKKTTQPKKATIPP
jgi:hypothetical protein